MKWISPGRVLRCRCSPLEFPMEFLCCGQVLSAGMLNQWMLSGVFTSHLIFEATSDHKTFLLLEVSYMAATQ